MHGNVTSLPIPEKKHRTITLTNARPIKIVEDQWPVIAQGIVCYKVDGAPYEWEIAIRLRKQKTALNDFWHIIHANYDIIDDDIQPDCDSDKNNQRVRVGHKFHTHFTHQSALVGSDGGKDLVTAIVEIGEELKERILKKEMHVYITHAVDRCCASLPPVEV